MATSSGAGKAHCLLGERPSTQQFEYLSFAHACNWQDYYGVNSQEQYGAGDSFDNDVEDLTATATRGSHAWDCSLTFKKGDRITKVVSR